MKRKYLLLIILLLIAIYLSIWFLLPKRQVSIHVHDKTVPEPVDYREHRELFYLAKHYRLTDQSGNFLDYKVDYSGFHPESDNRKERLTKELIADAKLLYLADAYGVYDYEDGLKSYEERLPFELIDIDLLFGGFDTEEVSLIEEFASNPDNILVGEHNVFGYPTYLYEGSSTRLQELFGVSYSGWLVRYYEDLEEVAYWVKLLYTRIYGKQFDLKGPAIVVVREDSSRSGWYGDLLIFQEEDFTRQYPTVNISEDNYLTEDASSRAPYLYWVEVLEVTSSNVKVLANYEFPLNEEALEKLEIRGIKPLIPAIIYKDDPDSAKKIYFSGDFVDQIPALLPSWLTYSVNIQKAITYLPGMPPQYSFYFRMYAPILKNILELAVLN
jgi:hypothetical protein